MTRFRENDIRFTEYPELRILLREELERKSRPIESPLVNGTNELAKAKDYSQFTKTPRGHEAFRNHSDREIINTLVPLSELKKARERSIPDYCQRNKIDLKKNERGQTVLRGREHVVINEYDIKNTRNGTTGSLIDLVAIHRNMTFVQAVAHINSNPRLLLLEKYMGTVNRKYQSFYVPKSERASPQTALEVLTQFIKVAGGKGKLASQLQEKSLAQVDRQGRVHLFPLGNATGSVEYSRNLENAWTRRIHGKAATPFYSARGSSGKALIFGDPTSLIRSFGDKLFESKNRETGVLGLLEPNPLLVQQYLAEYKHVSKLEFVPASPGNPTVGELDFLASLKSQGEQIGVSVGMTAQEKELQRTLEREGRDSGLSL